MEKRHLKAVLAAAAFALTATVGVTALAQKTGGTFRVLRLASQNSAVNLNPLLVGGGKNLFPTNSAIYETLFYVNNVTGKVEDVLGTDYKWSPDALTLTVTTRDGVKWSDGQAFDANDVAFTFNYIKQHPALDGSSLWSGGLTSVKATSPNTVVFTFGKKNTPVFPFVAHQMIVPEHIWSKVADPVTFTNPKPVATGPFLFDSATTQAIRVVKNPNYWMQGRPYIDGIVWQMVGGVDAILLNLLRGEGDFAYANIPDVKTTYIAKNPALNHIYWPATNGNFLFLNTTKAPLNDVALRQALAQAIDTKDVALKAYAGLVPIGDASGMLPAQRKEWLSPATQAAAQKFNVEAAKNKLKAAGYKLDAAGNLLGKDGKPLPTLRILVGAGWVDFIAMAQVISEDLKQLGINTTIDQQNWATYSGGLAAGTYDMAISWGWGSLGETPYNFYLQSLGSEFSAKPGANAVSNFSRYTNPQIDAALKSFRETADPKIQKNAIDTISRLFVRDVPMITLTDRVNFATYSTNRFEGFPTPENPYNDGSPDDTIGARMMFLNVRPK